MRLNKILVVGCLVLGFPAAGFGETFSQDDLFKPHTSTNVQASGTFERTVADIAKTDKLANARRLLELANSKILTAPNNDRYYAARAQCYEELEQLPLALADIDRAIKLNSRVGEYYSIRSDIKGRQKDYISEVKDLDSAIAIGPATGQLYMRRASSLALAHRFNDSLADAERAVKLEPNSAGVYAVRGTTKYYLHDYKGADFDCTKAESIEPSDFLTQQLRSVLKAVSPGERR